MTDPSQYFKGRTVQEQMNEVIGYVDTRSAEVAMNAIAADVAQVHQDMLDADADATAAAASAAAAAETLVNAVKKTGEASQSIAGNIEVSGTLKSAGTLYATGDASVGGNLGVGGSTNVGDLTATGIVTVPTPTGNNHAANKKYVDDQDALLVPIADINQHAVGLTGNQNNIAGDKKFLNPIEGRLIYPLYEAYSGILTSGKYRCFARIPAANVNTMIVLDALASANGGNYAYGRIIIGNPTSNPWFCKWVLRKSAGFLVASAIQIAKDSVTGDLMIFALNPTYTGLSIQLIYSKVGSSVTGAVRVDKVTDTTDYALDGTDAGIESIVAGSDM